MPEHEDDTAQRSWRLGGVGGTLRLAGARYWAASVLPALVGTTLPFWLRPPGFSFHWDGALEFLVATVLMHAGFCLLHARFEHRTDRGWTEPRLAAAALTCIVVASLLGFHLLRLVPHRIFVVYGLAVLYAGALYVAPPMRLSRRPGGEIVLAMSLGLLPVLGAYLVQTGDLTRKVYLAATPIYLAVLLWVWVEQMAIEQREGEERSESLVTSFGLRPSGRIVVPGLSVMLFATILVAVLSSSVMPLSLLALVLCLPTWKVVSVSWNAYDNPSEMRTARTVVSLVHSGLCIVLVVSSLWAAVAS